MTGLSVNDLGDEMYLLCHWQFPDTKGIYIVIKMKDKNRQEYFDLYEYGDTISYTTTPNQYGELIGPALIHNIEAIIEYAKNCKRYSIEYMK
jgi:hypothetical protein